MNIPIRSASVTAPRPPVFDARSAADDLTVYIVEDDLAVRAALRLLVRSYGWKPATFESGPLFLAESLSDEHACLVLDLNMPGVDGEEVLLRLRGRGSRLPVLAITGDREGPRLERMRRAGAQSVLMKPFGEAELESAIRLCVAQSAA